jgi:NAD(P)-dependent dehydrogenase (short-subunit alcohol dehydrogenase family)
VTGFDGQVVLVTGAGRGLGAAYARAFAERGATVVVHDAGLSLDGAGGDRSVADAAAREIGGIAAYEDLRDPGACLGLVEHTLDRCGRLDAIVHNAGLLAVEPLEEAGTHWDDIVHTTLDAAFHVTRAAWPAMKEQQYGRLVFTTSSRAMVPRESVSGFAAYAASRMGAFGLMLAVAAEGAAHGIRANAISPVVTGTRTSTRVQSDDLSPEHVVPAVLHLASDDCTYSGVVVHAEGGSFHTVAWMDGQSLEFEPEGVVPTT